MIFDAHHLPAHSRTDCVNLRSTDALAEFLEPMRGTWSFVLDGSAARHFLFWLNQKPHTPQQRGSGDHSSLRGA